MIPLVNLNAQHQNLAHEIRPAIDAVIRRGDFILGNEVSAFEREFAAYCEAKHCIGVGCGLDALTLILRAAGVGAGDEVITTASTFIATAFAVRHVGAVPVLVDHNPDTYTISPEQVSAAVTAKTKAIIPVHLHGHPADMDSIQTIADEHGLIVLEDACQAHGGRYRGKRCGSLGDASAFSFYPSKNLGAMGDGGAIVTNDDELARWCREARNYGATVRDHHTMRGYNTRLDEIQAAILRVKLRHLDDWNALRRRLAEQYRTKLNGSGIELPVERHDVEHVYHHFVIRTADRDDLASYLSVRGVSTAIHYPKPIHEQIAFGRSCVVPNPLVHTERAAEQALSLPMYPELQPGRVTLVCGLIREWALERNLGEVDVGARSMAAKGLRGPVPIAQPMQPSIDNSERANKTPVSQ